MAAPPVRWERMRSLRLPSRSNAYSKLRPGDTASSSAHPDSIDDTDVTVDIEDEKGEEGSGSIAQGNASASSSQSAGQHGAGGRSEEQAARSRQSEYGGHSPASSSKATRTTMGQSAESGQPAVLLLSRMLSASLILLLCISALLIAIVAMLAVWYRQGQLSFNTGNSSQPPAAVSLSSSAPSFLSSSALSAPFSPASSSSSVAAGVFPAGSPIVGYQLVSAQLPVNWGSSFAGKLRSSQSRLVTVGVLGDSVSAGSCCSNQYPSSSGRGYVNVLMQAFQSTQGDGGSGFVSPTDNRQFEGNDAYSSSVLPVTVSGFQDMTDRGSTDGRYYYAGSAGATMDFYVRGTVASVFYFVGPAGEIAYGTFSVTIDGQWAANINTASEYGTRQMRTSFAVSAGEHRLLIAVVSGAALIVGAAGRNGAGVVIDNMSVPGMQLVGLHHTRTDGNPFNNSDGGSPSTADLIIIMLGLNDASARKSLADFSGAMRAAVESYQQAGVADILIAMANGGLYNNDLYQAYRSHLPALASELFVAFVDLNDMATASYEQLSDRGFWARSPSARGIPCTAPPGEPSTSPNNANAVHPSDIGHWNIAHTLWPVISSQPSNLSGFSITWTPGRRGG